MQQPPAEPQLESSYMNTNFQRVTGMNIAFNNPKGDASQINWDKVRKQAMNLPDELGELLIALGANEEAVKKSIAILKQNTVFYMKPDVDQVRDSFCDLNVFSYGGHHLMGIDADADMRSVLSGVMTRFIKDDTDKTATIVKHSIKGVTAVYFEGEYPTMIMKSGRDQPDAPKGKFLKSASYIEPSFYALPVAEAVLVKPKLHGAFDPLQ